MEVEDEWVCDDEWVCEDEEEEEGVIQGKSGGGAEKEDSLSSAVTSKTKTASPPVRKIPSNDPKTSKGGLDRRKGDSQHRGASSVSDGARSTIGTKRGRSSSKPQDTYDNATGFKGIDDAKKRERDGARSLDEKYPWNAVDCPIDDRKMTRGDNRLLDEKYPWNSIDCFGDDVKRKNTETSKSLDEIYPWMGIECSAVDDTGLKECSESLDEKYPWNSIECSMGDASPTEKRKDSKPVDEKYPWNSTECSNGDASTSLLYDCISCSKAFPKQSELISHLKSEHADIELFDCSLCQESFVRQAELNNHIDDVHENEETYRCSLCKNVGHKDASRLISHMKAHHQMNTSMMYKDYLEGGIRTFRVKEVHLTEEMRARERSIIGSDAGSDSLEDNHSNHSSTDKDVTDRTAEHESHFVRDVGIRSCTFCECNESFTSKDKLDVHMNTAHNDVENLRCSLCDDTFKIAGKLRDHLKKDHSIGREMVYMDFLPDGWRTLKVKGEYSDAVKTSVELESSGNVTVNTMKDAKENPTKGAEENPSKRTKENSTKGGKEGVEKIDRVKNEQSPDNHDSDPQFSKPRSDVLPRRVCRYCPSKEYFQNKRLLKQHYRDFHNNRSTGNGDQRFKCSVCGLFYRDLKLVRRHMASLHNLEYSMLLLSDELSVDGYYVVEVEDRRRDVPYNCAVCKETFTSKSDLRTHTSLCTGSKAKSQWGVFF